MVCIGARRNKTFAEPGKNHQNQFLIKIVFLKILYAFYENSKVLVLLYFDEVKSR